MKKLGFGGSLLGCGADFGASCVVVISSVGVDIVFVAYKIRVRKFKASPSLFVRYISTVAQSRVSSHLDLIV